jgi:drug/metabolite transporter (DMT)-like permease
VQNENKGMALGVLGVCAFGLTLPATRVVVPYLDPVFIAAGRAVVAAFVAIILLSVFKQKTPTLKQFQQIAIIALGVVLGFPFLSSWAMQFVPASHGGVVLGLLPLATAAAGAVISHEKPSAAFWLVSAVGAGLVVLYALLQGSGSLHLADLALLGAILSAAIGYALGGKLSKDLGGWQVICWSLVFMLPFMIWPMIATAPESISLLPASAYFSFMYLALVSQLLAFFVWYKALSLGGIARVSQTQLLQPFVTLMASVLFLGEVIDAQTMIFIVLVVCFVWLSKKMPIGNVGQS